ncbi:MAG: endonuclease MutS2 [Calditrichaeota bacterium]|nr:endonuclease MutS2 [Calditrichota bacterium]
MEVVLQTLEFDRIRARLSAFAASPLGEELAGLVRPINDAVHLEETLTQTTELRNLVDFDQTVPMDGISDIRPSLKKAKITGSMLNAFQLSTVAETLAVVRRLQKYFSSRKEKIPTLNKLTAQLVSVKEVENEITRCIDTATGEVKDNASPALARIRKQLARAQVSARRKIDSLLKNFAEHGMLQENVISVRDGRLVLMVKEEFKRKVRGLVHDRSSSGSSLFIEPLETLEDNNRIRELLAEEEKEIEVVLLSLTDLIREHLDTVSLDVDVLGSLDLLYAKAGFSKALNANQPELVDGNLISIQQGRHPLLLLRMGEKNVVPLDLELGSDFRTCIISGPNAGGKTVALKTIGLLAMMVQSGLHVPVLPHSRFGKIDRIFASIGDQQSIENDLSTFSSHLEGLKDIAENATSQSLVLIDEIGSGTDPEEGTALAMALLERLTAKKCLTVVTTHQSALKAFAYQTDGVENASMEFDVRTLQPTYHFRIGVPGSSYAFEIAQRMGLPKEMNERARELVGSQKDKLEGLIIELENRVRHFRELEQTANVKETELRGLTKLYREMKEDLDRKEKKIKREAAREAERIISEANALVERTIREIRESNAAREKIIEARRNIDRERKKIQIIKQDVEPVEVVISTTPIVKGDHVRWEKAGTKGQVVSDKDKHGRVYLQANGAKVRVPIGELTKISNPPKAANRVVRVQMDRQQIKSSELDLRGLRTEEAQEKVDQFLDEAILAGFQQVRVIHGKGTGRLRSQIGDFLRRHPQVKSTRLGNWNEGDSGVTVVELKEQ